MTYETLRIVALRLICEYPTDPCDSGKNRKLASRGQFTICMPCQVRRIAESIKPTVPPLPR